MNYKLLGEKELRSLEAIFIRASRSGELPLEYAETACRALPKLLDYIRHLLRLVHCMSHHL